MSRYFFDTVGTVHDPDLEGCEFPNLAQAKLAAVIFAGAYLRDNPTLIFDSTWHVKIRGDNEAVLYTVTIEGHETKTADVLVASSFDQEIRPQP
jgi:hypothetical protein